MKISRILVLLQFALPAALVLTSKPSPQHALGFAVVGVGIAIEIWAIITMGPRRLSIMPEVQSNANLTTSGPYRFIRHPMYTALLLASIGLTFSPYMTWKVIATCSLAFVLAAKSEIEERQLRNRFAEYEAYTRKTKRFIPFVW